MPPAIQPIDALWHSLCPSFTRFSQTEAIPLLRGPQRRRIHRAAIVCAPTTLPIRFIALPQLRLATPTKSRWHRRAPQLSQSYQQSDETESVAIARKGSTAALYQQLRNVSARGNYAAVQLLVKALVLEHGENPNSQLYRALILANTCPDHGSAAEVERLLQEMEQEGTVPDSAIYHAVLKALAIHPNYLLRGAILEELRQRWLTLTLGGWQDVIAGCIRDRQIEMAMEKLEEMQKAGMVPAPWVYDLLIYTLCDTSDFDDALQLMRQREANGELDISITVWYYLLDKASTAFHHDATRYVWSKRVKNEYLNPSSGMCISVLNTAARHADPRLANSVLVVLRTRAESLQPHHYEALLEAYLAASDLPSALSTLYGMASTKHTVTEATTRPLYLYLRELWARPGEALALYWQRIDQAPIPVPAVNAVIEAQVHQSDLAAAMETYKILATLNPSGPTTATFNALLRGCHRSTRKDLAMFVAAEMVALGVAPDALTYDRLVLVCVAGKAGGDHLDDAWRYVEEMVGAGWWLRGGTLATLVRRSCEAADERVWGLVEQMGERGMAVAGVTAWLEGNWGRKDLMGVKGRFG